MATKTRRRRTRKPRATAPPVANGQTREPEQLEGIRYDSIDAMNPDDPARALYVGLIEAYQAVKDAAARLGADAPESLRKAADEALYDARNMLADALQGLCDWQFRVCGLVYRRILYLSVPDHGHGGYAVLLVVENVVDQLPELGR